jgi:hypothetical protein
MLLFTLNLEISPGDAADSIDVPAKTAVKLSRFLVPPQTVNPVAGVDDLAFLVPVDEPLSVGAPPVTPSLVSDLSFDAEGLVRVMGDSAGYLTGAPLDIGGIARPLFRVEWDGELLSDRNLVIEFLRGLEVGTQVGHERNAFDIELDGPGSGITKVRPVEPFLDEQMGMKAYRISVLCEQVL